MVIYARLVYFISFFFFPLHCETDVDQEVTTATGDEKRRSRRKDYSDLPSGKNE
jgi:hypothetical protein